ncbi:MAG: PIN domain-containing protein [Acidobacteriota bacterium]
MAALIYLDTHVVAWLFAGRVDLFPPAARKLLDENDLLISPAVVLELQYLHEIRRTADPAQVVVESLEDAIGLKVCDQPFPPIIGAALDQHWTRDPFDRILVAQAALREAPLVTRDRNIRDHYPHAVWE